MWIRYILTLFVAVNLFGNGEFNDFLSVKEKEWLKKNRVIKMCNNPNWEPIEFVENGLPKGIAIDLLKEIEKKLELSFKYVPTNSWSSSQEYLKDKKCDILPAATPTHIRKKYAIFTDSHLEYKLAIITKNDKPFIASIKDVIDKPMSRKKGSGLIAKLKNSYPNINIIETSGYEESLKKVSKGDVYYTLATLPVASHFISKFGLYNLQIAGYTKMRFNLSIAVRDDKEILRDILNKVLITIPDSYISRIEKEWSSVKIEQTDPVNYKYMIQIALVVFFILLFIIYRQTHIRKYHAELRETNEKFFKMLTSTIEAVLIIHNDEVIELNDSAARMFGAISKEQMIGKNIFDFVDESSKGKVRKKIDSSFTRGDEVKLVNFDGIKFPALLQSTDFDSRSEHIKIVAILDLSEMKRKEEMLLQSGKMAQMGEMIGNIAHQWRQPLNVITTAATGIKIKKEYDILDEKEHIELIDTITKNANYLSDTIDTFRNFIKEKVELKRVVVQDRIDYALNIIESRLTNAHVKVIKNIPYEKKVYIEVVMGELTQVIINIINNAVDIMQEKGVDDKWIKIDLDIKPKKAIITIEDNGGGVSKEIKDKIFEPYFTTKHQSMGTGIGLYMSYDIIVNHMEGKLYVNNTPNGAKFFIELGILEE